MILSQFVSTSNYAKPIPVPQAPFASTNYGFDPGVGNNYGLGPTFANSKTIQTQATVANARPSWWWLIIAVAGVWLCVK